MNAGTTQRGASPGSMPPVPEEIRTNWRYLVGAGVVIAVLGVLAMLAPYVAGVGLSILFGAILVVGGLTNVAQAFSASGWRGSLYQVALALVYTVAGIALLVNPAFGMTTLTLLLLVYFALEGVTEVVMGIRLRNEPHWFYYVLSGVVSLVLAGLLFVGFPSTSFWALGVLFGLNLLSTGLTLILVGNLTRKATAAGSPGALGTGPGG